MKLYLQIRIINISENHHFQTLWKKHEVSFIPNEKVEFQDEAWGEETKPINKIIVDLDNDLCFVYLSDIDCDSDQRCNEIENIHTANGWAPPSDYKIPL